MDYVYQIRIRAQLGVEWSDWFAGLRVTPDGPDETLLTGKLDQTGLHGVLARVRDLNLTLVAVNQLRSDVETEQNEAEKRT